LGHLQKWKSDFQRTEELLRETAGEDLVALIFLTNRWGSDRWAVFSYLVTPGSQNSRKTGAAR
jgi:hypothetical protein